MPTPLRRPRAAAAALMLGAVLALAAAPAALGQAGAGGTAGGAAGDAAAALPEHIQEGSRQLEALRRQLRGQRRQLEDLSTRRRDEQTEMKAISREMALVKELLAGLDTRERALQAEIDSVRRRLAVHEREHAGHRARLAARLRAVYQRGPRRDLELVLSAGSFSSLMSRLKFATILARMDSRLVERTREAGLRVLAEQQRLQAALTEIWEAREEARLERARLADLEARRRQDLVVIEAERDATAARIDELQSREKQLQDMLAELERRRAEQGEAGGGFDGLAGRLQWPVEGEVVQGFGRSVHPEFKTVTVSNGIAIAAPQGSPVYAVEGGKVAFADHLPGFGVCVIVEHGAGYYSLYANLDRIFVTRGGEVARGEVVAEVGQAEEGGPRLYFELRRGKTPLDPTAWLAPRPRER